MPTHKTIYERRPPAAGVVDASLRSTTDRVYWLDDVKDAPQWDSLDGTRLADLTVVGGGYCGLWTAVLAKKRNPFSHKWAGAIDASTRFCAFHGLARGGGPTLPASRALASVPPDLPPTSWWIASRANRPHAPS